MGRAYYIHHYTRPTVACIHVLFGGIQDNILHKRFFIWCSISVKILISNEWILLYVAFCTIMVISRQKETRSRDYALLLFWMTLRVLYSAEYHIGSTVHSRPFNSLKHCICTTTTTKILLDRDSNMVPPGYKPQSIRMSHQGRPLIFKARKIKNGAIVFPLFEILRKIW